MTFNHADKFVLTLLNVFLHVKQFQKKPANSEHIV